MARSTLSPMTVLLAVLAVAAYQNRNRLLDMLDSRGAKRAVTKRPALSGLGSEQVVAAASLDGPRRGPRVRERSR